MIIDCCHYLLIACFSLQTFEVLAFTLNLSLLILLVCFLSVHLGLASNILHSHVNTPLIYQLSAAWSNHEGSLLVWCCLLSWCALWSKLGTDVKSVSKKEWWKPPSILRTFQLGEPASIFKDKSGPLKMWVPPSFFFESGPLLKNPQKLLEIKRGEPLFFRTKKIVTTLLIQIKSGLRPLLSQKIKVDIKCPHEWTFCVPSQLKGLLDRCEVFVLWMCLLSLVTSNCFFKTPFLCFQSFHALNPVLQDIVLAIHPPCIYLAYAASACAFYLSLHSTWCRFWVTLCWCCLTFGIGLGSWWAYHELGWGGWWFWDPVENASLMPWLSVTATIHSIRFPRLTNWALITCQLTFVCCILGTFLVRSGLLASVHSFASGGFWLIGFCSVLLLRIAWIWGSPLLLTKLSGGNRLQLKGFPQLKGSKNRIEGFHHSLFQ